MTEYQRIPSHEGHADAAEAEERVNELSLQNPLTQSTIEEFNRPEPAWWKRVAVLITMFVLAWGAFKLGRAGTATKPQVIYASRYSDEFKYRPAASPVITEYLKDGRIRLRGASPGGIGVQEGVDIPLSPEKKALQDKKNRERAEQEALERVRAAKKKTQEKRKRRKAGRKGGEP